jgi:hypothetical protein
MGCRGPRMCNACGNLCCGSDEFGGCGCHSCGDPECYAADCLMCGEPDCDGDCFDAEGVVDQGFILRVLT